MQHTQEDKKTPEKSRAITSPNYQRLTKTSLEKLPPANIEAEQAILGAVLLDPGFTIPAVLSVMEPDDFYRGSHQKLFAACRTLAAQNHNDDPLDLILLKEQCLHEGILDEVGGPAYLAALVDAVPTAANVTYHARLVRQRSLQRKLLTLCLSTATDIYDESGATSIEEITEAINALYRQTFVGRPVFWSQNNTGIATAIEEDRYLRFLFNQFGFAMLEINKTVMFVQRKDMILQETTWVKSTNKTMKDALKRYCQDQARNDVWRCLLRQNRLFSYASLTGLDTLKNTFCKDTQETCRLFFQNGVIEITATSVAFLPYNQIEGYVWEENISPHTYHGRYNLDIKRRVREDLYTAMKTRTQAHKVRVLRRVLNAIYYQEKDQHTILTDQAIIDLIDTMIQDCEEAQKEFAKGQRHDLVEREIQEIEILEEYYCQDRTNSEYHQLLEYVSREQIDDYDGKRYSVDNLHVFEFALAHLVHRYNDPVNMRAVILADSNPSFVSDGRRGKKIILDALKHIRGPGVVIKEDGKAFDQSGRFVYQQIRPNTQILIIDDVAEEFNFKGLYSAITDGMVIEGKGIARFRFEFEDNPKIVITTNHPCYEEDISSTERAILLPISDYFIREKRTPFQVFGHRLYDDWSEPEWSRFFDYVIKIIQRYLQRPDPSITPIPDLTIFNANKLLLKVPEPMVNYLDELPKDVDHERKTVISELEAMGLKFRSSHTFGKLLHTYCRLRGYTLKTNSRDGRYIINSVQYLHFIPVTPDLPGLKYARKNTSP